MQGERVRIDQNYRMKTLPFMAVLIAASLVLPWSLAAESSTAITGDIAGARLRRLAGCEACVVLIRAESQAAIRVALDKNGHFAANGLPEGLYEIRLVDPDGAPVIRTVRNIPLVGGREMHITIDTDREDAAGHRYTQGDIELAVKPLAEHVMTLLRNPAK